MKKWVNKNPEWQTQPVERGAYYSYFFGQNGIYNLVTGFLATYLLFQGIDAAKTAGVMLAVKIWDAVNDALFGVIFDSVHFKSKKKFIPWLKIASIATPITTVLLFVIPHGASETVKLAWLAVAYMLWDTAYTLCDVPAFGLITAMTERVEERNSVLSFKGIFAGAGYAISFLAGTVLVSEQVGISFGVASIFVAVVAIVTMLPICFKGKERYVGNDDESFTLKKMFSYVIHNKYLLIYYLGILFYSGLQTNAYFHQFVAYYIYDNSLFALLIGAISAVPSLVMALFVPKMLRKMDKITLYRICCIIFVVLSVVIWAVGKNNFILFTVLYTIRAIPAAVFGVIMFIFTPDCAEYGQFKTGTNAKGITFAIQTFMVKLTAAISSALGLFMLGLFKWQEINADSFEDLQALNITQPDSAINGLWFIYNLVPAIGALVAYGIWHFYKLKDKDVQVMADCNSGKISHKEAEKLLSRDYGPYDVYEKNVAQRNANKASDDETVTKEEVKK